MGYVIIFGVLFILPALLGVAVAKLRNGTLDDENVLSDHFILAGCFAFVICVSVFCAVSETALESGGPSGRALGVLAGGYLLVGFMIGQINPQKK
jgi:hypothetical protein